MEIKKEKNGTDLTLALAGRLDTTTAPELESVVDQDCTDIQKLMFDLQELEYISSAGLRVFIKAQKKMNEQGEMVICNVNDTVREIFDITGLLSIFTVL